MHSSQHDQQDETIPWYEKEGASSKRPRYGFSQIVNGVQHLEGLSRAQSERIVQAVLDQVILALISGYKVYLPRVGSFAAHHQKPRRGVHPKTREPITIGESVRVHFSAAIPLVRSLGTRISEFSKIAALAETELEAKEPEEIQN